MQYVMRAAVQARRFAGIGAICALGIGLGACANMQDNDRQRAMPVMPEDRMRSYNDGTVTVYPLQGPIPADPADRAGNEGNIRAPHSSHDDSAVTVYSLDDSARESRSTIAKGGAVEARPRYESQRSESQTGFEDNAHDRVGKNNTSSPFAATGQDDTADADAGNSQTDRTGMGGRRARAQSTESSGGAFTDYGQDTGVYAGDYAGDNDGKQERTGDKRADSRASAQKAQQSDNRRLLTGP